MKKVSFIIFAIATVSVSIITSCKKDDNDQVPVANVDQRILDDFASHIALDSYTELASATNKMYQDIQALHTNPTQAGLTECRDNWRNARKTWEKTEAYLFGPVATDNIDPRIDTWPVNFNDLDVVINSPDVFTESYINGLDDALKGFHPIEYLLFGTDGNKTHLDFTARQFEYLEALALNLKQLTMQLANNWHPSNPSSYYHDWVTAGNGSTIYQSRKSACEELVAAMAGICDEVANGKISEPFLTQNPELEESPFSGNSLTDFSNNMRGVENVYTGKFSSNGVGLEDLVREHNLSLDATIKTKIANAIAALGNITVPFGTAISTQPIQVQNAIDAINELKTVIDDDLMQLVQLHVH